MKGKILGEQTSLSVAFVRRGLHIGLHPRDLHWGRLLNLVSAFRSAGLDLDLSGYPIFRANSGPCLISPCSPQVPVVFLSAPPADQGLGGRDQELGI
jgi:hypothetical protein